jgi:hypothetical protein
MELFPLTHNSSTDGYTLPPTCDSSEVCPLGTKAFRSCHECYSRFCGLGRGGRPTGSGARELNVLSTSKLFLRYPFLTVVYVSIIQANL